MLRRLLLTGGLIVVGGDKDAVAQVFLGILVSATWLSLVLHQKPYKSEWDSILSASLSFSVLVMLVSGVCIKLFDLTSSEADASQKEMFGVVLVLAILICMMISLASIIMSTEMLRDRMAAYFFPPASMMLKKKKERITILMKQLNDMKGSDVSQDKKNKLEERITVKIKIADQPTIYHPIQQDLIK